MTRSLRRSAFGLAALLPLAGGALLAAAPVASADVVAPGDGTVFTSYATFDIRASYERSSSDHRLTLTSPGGPAVTVATAQSGLNGGTMTYSLDTGCWTFPSSSCSGRRLAPNGTWTVTQSGGSNSTTTFVTRIRPEAPTGVGATALNPREARVTWRAGSEPDLTGWAVLEGSDVVAEAGRSACDGGTCSAVVSYATEGSGEHTFTVMAFRSVAPGSSSTLESPTSSPASVRLDAPPPPPPPEEPASEPSSGGDTGGSGGTTEGSGSGSGETSGGSGSGGTGSTGGGTSGGGTSGSGGSGSGSGNDPGSGSGTGSGSGSGSGSAPGSGSGSGGGFGGSPFGTGTSESVANADQRAVEQRKAFALGFSAFGPKLGIPKLPPLPQAQAPAIAPELADGSFEPTLGFEDQVLTERVPVTSQGPTERVRNVVGSALDSERLIRSTAVALVLLLAAAHLRRWLGASTEEQ